VTESWFELKGLRKRVEKMLCLLEEVGFLQEPAMKAGGQEFFLRLELKVECD
jgi:hypothetical protein